MLRILVLLLAITMPLTAWMAQRGWFGSDIGSVSDRYPSLIVAAGYAFSIWALIFALSIGFAVLQLRRDDPFLARLEAPAAAIFALTSLWMLAFSGGQFVLALLVILALLGSLLVLVVRIAPAPRRLTPLERVLVRWTFLIYCAWVTLATTLNVAQTLLAYRIDPGVSAVVWSLFLLALAGLLLLVINRRVRGDLVFTSTAWWALIAIWVKQSPSPASGSDVIAWSALAIATVLLAHTLWLRLRSPA